MSSFTLKLTSLAFALFAICSNAFSQMTPAVVNDATSPIRVLSVTANETDFLHDVLVTNQSSQAVTELQFGVIMGVPAGCGPKQLVGSEEKLRMDYVNLPPSAQIHLSDYMFAPAKISAYRQSSMAKDVYTQMAVIYVRYSDGSEWKSARSTGMYNPTWFGSYASSHCGTLPAPKLLTGLLTTNAPSPKRCSFGAEGSSHYICDTSEGQSCSVVNATTCTNTICTTPPLAKIKLERP